MAYLLWTCICIFLGFKLITTQALCTEEPVGGYGACPASTTLHVQVLADSEISVCQKHCYNWAQCYVFSFSISAEQCTMYPCENFGSFTASSDYKLFRCKGTSSDSALSNTDNSGVNPPGLQNPSLISTAETTTEPLTSATDTSLSITTTVTSGLATSGSTSTLPTSSTTEGTTSQSQISDTSLSITTTVTSGFVTSGSTSTLPTSSTTEGTTSQTQISGSNWIEIKSLKGKLTTSGNQVMEATVRSRIECCAMCSTSTECISVFFNSYSGTCLGHGTVYITIYPAVIDNQYAYYSQIIS